MQVFAACPRGFSMEDNCGALVRELQQLWSEIGESDAEKDRMLLELEKECLDVYRRKVDEVNNARARLHQAVAAKEAELVALVAALGELNLQPDRNKRLMPLKEQLESVNPLLENLKVRKEERIKQFTDVKVQIEKIKGEISGCSHLNDLAVNHINVDERDLSLRKLNEYQTHLSSIQKEKSDRLHKVLGCIDEVHSLCCVLGRDFGKIVSEVHPSLRETSPGNSTNISNNTLDGLAQTILKLKLEKKERIKKLKDTMASLFELWSLMDSPEEEMNRFGKMTHIFGLLEHEITEAGLLSQETMEQVSAEVEKLTALKASRMKELVLKKRLELEEICKRAHIEPDVSTALEKSSAMIDSGIVDPSELLATIEGQIVKAREEFTSRKEITDRIDKWLAACDEESWLEEYNQDGNRYSSARGVHINLKRAERARVTVKKIPGMVENLMNRTFAWEEERNMPFLYDGVRLAVFLEDYKLSRQQKEEEKKRFRDNKKLHDMLLTEREAIYGSKPIPKKTSSWRKQNGTSVNGNVPMTPTPRRHSVSSATSDLLTPRSNAGCKNGYFKQMRKLSSGPLNFVALPKEDTISFASFCDSEPESLLQG